MSWIFWAIGAFGVSGVLFGGAVLVLGWPVVAGSRIGRIAIAIVVGAAMIYGLYLRGKREGRKAERAKLKRLTEKEVANAMAEADRIDGLSDDDVDRELRDRWFSK